MADHYSLIPASYLVFRRGGKVLLLKRANTGYMDGFYSLPAGHVDPGEAALAAAVREAKEEVLLEVELTSLRLAHTMQAKVEEKDRAANDRLDLFFEVTDWRGEPVNAEPEKCDEIRWVEMNDLPDNMVPKVRQALEMIAAGEPYSDYGF